MNPDFHSELNRILRYSMSTVTNLLEQLHTRPEARLPQPEGADPSSNDHTLFRGVVADALDDAERGSESALLRDHNQHVVVRDGRVRAGTFSDEHWYDPAKQAGWLAEGAPLLDWVSVHPPLPRAVNRHPYGTVFLTQEGEAGTPAVSEYLHYSEVPKRIANLLAPYSPAGGEEKDQFQQSLHDLLNAPTEVVDSDHPSERR